MPLVRGVCGSRLEYSEGLGIGASNLDFRGLGWVVGVEGLGRACIGLSVRVTDSEPVSCDVKRSSELAG